MISRVRIHHREKIAEKSFRWQHYKRSKTSQKLVSFILCLWKPFCSIFFRHPTMTQHILSPRRSSKHRSVATQSPSSFRRRRKRRQKTSRRFDRNVRSSTSAKTWSRLKNFISTEEFCLSLSTVRKAEKALRKIEKVLGQIERVLRQIEKDWESS